MQDIIPLIVTFLTYALPTLAAWFAGKAIYKKALEITINVYDDVAEVVREGQDLRAAVTAALVDTKVTEEEFAVIYKEYCDLMDDLDKMVVDGRTMISIYRELFGVIIGAFKTKLGK